jgi:hypothetical protein
MEPQDLLKTNTMSYDDYTALAEKLAAEGRTSGPNQSESLLAYSKLNLQRMKRLNKTSVPGPVMQAAVKNLPFAMRWVAITELWCGDAAQNLPYIAKLASLSQKITFELVLRDVNLDYMDQFLTNGARSIPKIVMYHAENNNPIATWGPRPALVQAKVMDYKNMTGEKPAFEDFSTEIHQWYTSNKNAALELELLAIFRQISARETAL